MNAASILITTFQQWSFVNAQVITVNLIFINKTTRPFIGDFFLDAFSFLSIFFVILQFLSCFFSLLTFWCLGNLCLPRNVSKLHQTIKNNCLRSNLINYAHHNFIHIVRFSVLYRNFCSRFTLQSNLIILSWQNVCGSNESMKHAK